jgi:hypothetical protein
MGVALYAFTQAPAFALYIQPQTFHHLWSPGQQIKVCWVPAIDANEEIPRRVHQMVDEQWGRYSSLTFIGWDTCTKEVEPTPEEKAQDPNAPKTRVPTDDPAELDNDTILLRETDGFFDRSDSTDLGRAESGASVIELNFHTSDLSHLPPGIRDIVGIYCGEEGPDCVGAVAVHEFGHRLGFAHEHDRPEFNSVCTTPLLHQRITSHRIAGFDLTTYDFDSAMNYCRGLNTATLSPKDIAGLQRVYGRKPEGAIVSRTGLCTTGLSPTDGGSTGRVSLEPCLDPKEARARLLGQQWSFDVESGEARFALEPNRLCLERQQLGHVPGDGIGVAPCFDGGTRWFGGPVSIMTMGGMVIVPFQGKVISVPPEFDDPNLVEELRDNIRKLPGAGPIIDKIWDGADWVWSKVTGIFSFSIVAGPALDPHLIEGPGGFWHKVHFAPPGWTLKSTHQISWQGQCMDIGTGEPGTQATLATCDASRDSQKFFFKPSGHIKTAFSGLCLMLRDGNGEPNPAGETGLIEGGGPKKYGDLQQVIAWNCESAAEPPFDPSAPSMRYSGDAMDQMFWVSGPIVPRGEPTTTCIDRHNAIPPLSMGSCGTVFVGLEPYFAASVSEVWDHYVSDPSTAPVIDLPNSPLTAEATGPDGAKVTFSTSAHDPLEGPLDVTFQGYRSGSTFPLDKPITVTVRAVDNTGSETTRDLVVQVQDTQPPVLSLPSDILVDATSAQGAKVAFSVGAHDAVDGDVVAKAEPPSGSLFALGVPTTVTVTAVDSRGHEAVGHFTVTVRDRTAPDLVVPPDMTVEAESPAGSRVTFQTSAQDAVDGTVVPASNPPSGSVFALGSTLVTVRAVDRAGNEAVKTFRVVVADTTKPVVTAPPDITITMCKLPNIGKAKVFDAASHPDPANNAPTTFPLGTTVVTWTATDPSGNVGKATQRVTAELGDDATCCPSGTKVILGTSGSDVLTGTSGRDCILGRGGDDVIDAREGDDFISGGAGNDTINAGPGNDYVTGGDGNDIIDAGPGNDVVNGGPGVDTIMAGTGSDIIDGGGDQDVCSVPPDGQDKVKGCP